MAVFSLFSLCACSLVKTDADAVSKQEVMRIGDTVMTRADITSAFYTYYQNNAAYFSYYGSDTIEESFYLWTIMREIVKHEADTLFKNGTLTYTKEDEKDVWKSVCDYFYENVNNYEKAKYKLADYLEENYPIWLRDDDEEEDKKVFEPYKKPEIKKREDTENVDKWTDELIKTEKVAALKDYIFSYSESKDENEEESERIKIDSSTYSEGSGLIYNSRNDAFSSYIQSLVINAKSNGTSTDEGVVLENELIRIYNSFYESKLTTIFQEYYLNDYIFVDPNSLLNAENVKQEIVDRFLKKYYSDLQNNIGEKSYVSTMTSSDGASLVLYNYNGLNFYFTVQHILVSFDDYMKEAIKDLFGYNSSSSKKYNLDVYNAYKNGRDALAEKYPMMSKLNEDNAELFKSLQFDKYVKYYYYDKDSLGNADKNYGYIEVQKVDNEDGTVTYKDKSSETTYPETKVQRMITADDIINCYIENFNTLMGESGLLKTYFDKIYEEKTSGAARTENPSDEETEESDLQYIYDMFDNICAKYEKEEGFKVAKRKVASLLFIEFEWLFSGDNLDNELSNKMGYVMSNYDDKNGSWVVEFAEGARQLIENILGEEPQKDDGQAVLDKLNEYFANTTIDKDSLIKITSDYGYHIIKVEDIFVQGGSLIDMTDMDGAQKDTNGKYQEDFVNSVIDALEKTYLCVGSNETLYDYFYDEIYYEQVGTESKSGTYFVDKQYEWLNSYYDADDVVYVDKMTYDELVDAIS